MRLSGSERPAFKVDLAHTSPITSKRCTQPHGECGRVVRWPSALGWWCRRRRACHSSCNWGGIPGLAGPFHLHPAVRWETQKIQELIMSLLGFCSAVWGWIRPPRSSSSSPRPLHATPTHPSSPTSFNSSTSLIPLFYLSITFPFTPLLFAHSLFFYPCLFHFTPSPTSLNIPLPTIIKHLTLGRAAPPLQPPAFTQSLCSLVMCAYPQGRGPLWRPGPPGGLHCAVICVCNLWGISVNATLSGWKNLLAHSQFIESTKVQSASVHAFCSPSPRSFPVYTKSMQNSRLRRGRGEGAESCQLPLSWQHV